MTARALEDGVGLSGLTVLLHEETGELIQAGTTDEDGEASFESPPPGAAITLLQPGTCTPPFSLYTVIEVEADDVLVIGTLGTDGDPTTYDVRVSYPGPFTGADTYVSAFPCRTFGVVNPASVVTETIGTQLLVQRRDEALWSRYQKELP